MHAFARHLHNTTREKSVTKTKGLILNGGWRYDVMGWFIDTFMFRRQWRELRHKTINMARIQPGERVHDVGCGTGTLVLQAARSTGRAGSVAGVDPSTKHIGWARLKVARRNVPIDFQIGVIENLPYPDQTFDVVLSTLMMHHLPNSLKKQGFTEIARVLKPGGRLVIADFTPKKDRKAKAARFHAGGSSMQDLVAMAADAGFDHLKTEDMQPLRFSFFPGAGFVWANKN